MNCSWCVNDEFKNQKFLSPSSKNSLSYQSLLGRHTKVRKTKEITVLNRSKISLKRNQENNNRSIKEETLSPQNHATISLHLSKNKNVSNFKRSPENKNIDKVISNKHQERSMTSHKMFNTCSFKNQLNCNKKPINVKIFYSNAYPPQKGYNPQTKIEHNKAISFRNLPNRIFSTILDSQTKNCQNQNFSEGFNDIKINHKTINKFPEQQVPRTKDFDFQNLQKSNSTTRRELKIKRLHSATETTFQQNNQKSSMAKSLKTLGLGHLEEIACKKTESIADPNEPIEQFSEVIFGMRKIQYPGPKMINSETKILEKQHKNISNKKTIVNSGDRKQSYSQK